MSFVARRPGISLSLLFRGQRRVPEGGYEAVGADEDVIDASKVRELERRVRDLKRLLGRKTTVTAIPREILDLARKKANLTAVLEHSRGHFAMRAVAKPCVERLDVAGSPR